MPDPSDRTEVPRPSARELLRSVGGWWGLASGVLPTLAFVVPESLTSSIPLAVAYTVGVVLVLALAQVFRRREAAWGALLGGALLAAGSAVLALLTGRAGDNFVPGMVVNGVLLAVLVGSLLLQKPLVWVGIQWFQGNGTPAPERTRAVGWAVTLVWVGVFALRLLAEVPLYIWSLHTGSVLWLGGARVILGVPLFALGMLTSWFLLRSSVRSGSGGAHPRT